ncbi:histone-lysine N-methyltransferase SETMAR [Elysia marginata]|uniref:Histone-lysine N-methyltransferase SETMAR n=1 Tax=Elysia marginata TaxID=1093978 RepID=A0AAV4GZ93_9GAST|nr:histone-lysine N-methyltransferase SETMAR [Elysia marginata]
MRKATVSRHELGINVSGVKIDSVLSFSNRSSPNAEKKPKFSTQSVSSTDRYSLNTRPSSTRHVAPRMHDGLIRVIHTTHGFAGTKGLLSQPQGHGATRRRQAERKKSYIFGEIDYLRDKLGFCMPSVKETLESEQLRRYQVPNSHGFQNVSQQRLLTVQHILFERALSSANQKFLRKSNFEINTIIKDETSAPKKKEKKGKLESEQYIILLDANTRRAKQIDDRAKFAVTQEVCRHELKSKTLEQAGEFDTQRFVENKREIEKEKKKKRVRRRKGRGRGRSITATSEDNVKRVDELIRQDRRLKLHEIASSLKISETSAHSVVFDELGYRKVSAKWVPKQLTDNHEEQRLVICRELLRRSKSSRRVHGHTANAGGDFLGEAIRRKRPGQLTNGVILQHDNATPHTARVTQGWLEKYGWEILPHPPHSPDLAPSDYHLFGPLKRELAGKRFDDD